MVAAGIETATESGIGIGIVIAGVMDARVMTAIVTAIGRTRVIKFRYTTTRPAISPETTAKLMTRMRTQ
jgi:hypothetical protein